MAPLVLGWGYAGSDSALRGIKATVYAYTHTDYPPNSLLQNRVGAPPGRVHSSSETNYVRRLREGQSAKHLRPFLSSLFNTTTGGTSGKHAAGVAKRQPQREDRTRGPDSVG